MFQFQQVTRVEKSERGAGTVSKRAFIRTDHLLFLTEETKQSLCIRLY